MVWLYKYLTSPRAVLIPISPVLGRFSRKTTGTRLGYIDSVAQKTKNKKEKKN